MGHLRSLFEEMGYADVASFIASGNVIFSSTSHDCEAHEAKIQTHLREALSYEVATFIRTPEELQQVAAVELLEGLDELQPLRSARVERQQLG